jgi:hypothetical protein
VTDNRHYPRVNDPEYEMIRKEMEKTSDVYFNLSDDGNSEKESDSFSKAMSLPDNFGVTVLSGNEIFWRGVNATADNQIDKIRLIDGRSGLWTRQQKAINAKTFGKISNTFGKVANTTAYVAPIVIDEYENFNKDASVSEHIADVTVDVTVTWASIKIAGIAGSKVGSAAGTYFSPVLELWLGV